MILVLSFFYLVASKLQIFYVIWKKKKVDTGQVEEIGNEFCFNPKNFYLKRDKFFRIKFTNRVTI